MVKSKQMTTGGSKRNHLSVSFEKESGGHPPRTKATINNDSAGGRRDQGKPVRVERITIRRSKGSEVKAISVDL